MDIHNHKRLDTIRFAVEKWRKCAKRASIGSDVAIKCFDFGLTDGDFKIKFIKHANNYEQAEAQGKLLFRWLGLLPNEQKAAPERIFYIEQAIVAAMPQDIRLEYLNAVYGCTGVFVGVASGNNACIDNMALNLTKENAEAQVAVLEGDNPAQAIKELEESIGTSLAAIDALKKRAEHALLREVG